MYRQSMRLKRYLYLAHRWLGIVLCLFMALWFFSGVVMMYVGYPKLTPQEHLQSLPALDSSTCCAPLAQVQAALPPGSTLRSLRLTSIGGEPTYVAGLGKNDFVAVNGQSGQRVAAVDVPQAIKSAKAFMHGTATYLGPITEDAWTHSRALDGHRPLHRVEMQGESTTLLYISSSTGEVVRDATATERAWNWVGAWLHWLYPLRGGWADAWWTSIVIYGSLAATVLSLCGLWIGGLRWRRQPYANGSRSPYRDGWARWHHWLGLGGGLLVVAWIVSGLFSMNPWKIFDAGAARPKIPTTLALAGSRSPTQALRCLQGSDFSGSELEWTLFGQEIFILARNAEGESLLLSPGEHCAPVRSHDMTRLQEEGTRLLPAAQVTQATVQAAYDWHYYGRATHTMSGHLARPLPVLRLQFDDAAQTWLYLDPRTGSIVQRLDSHSRIKRWLFSFLHSWDWLPLLAQRPLWDILLVLGSLAGFLLSLSGILLGWRRLWRRA